MTNSEFNAAVNADIRALMRLPGVGDEITWPAFTGHPNDPRDPGEPDDYDALDRDGKVQRLAEDFDRSELAHMIVDRDDRMERLERRIARLERALRAWS